MTRWLAVIIVLLAVSGCGEYDDSRNRHEACNQMGGNYTEKDGKWTCSNRVE